MKNRIKYLDDGRWTQYAQERLGVPNEMATVTGLEKLIQNGYFLEKRQLYPTFTHQRITFLVLPKEIYDYYFGYLFSRDWQSDHLRITGYIWLMGYPVVYE